MKEKVGILGGTFNPVHNGHLFLALEAAHHLGLDRVLLMPNRLPPHKESPSISAELRLEMLEQAVADEPRLRASPVELDRSGRSYTIDTLEALGDEHDWVFICGADAFLSPWHRPEDVLRRLNTLLLAHRHGFPDELPPILREMPGELRAKVEHLDFPDVAISSSDIRKRIAEARPYRFLLPDAVYRTIEEKQLYRGGAPTVKEKGLGLG